MQAQTIEHGTNPANNLLENNPPNEDASDKQLQHPNPSENNIGKLAILPNETLFHIIYFLGIEQRLIFSLTNKYIKNLVSDTVSKEFFHRLQLLYDAELKNSELLSRINRHSAVYIKETDFFNPKPKLAIPATFSDFPRAYEILNHFCCNLLHEKLINKKSLSHEGKLFIRCVIAVINQDNLSLATLLESCMSELSYEKFNNAIKLVDKNNNAWEKLLYLACRVGNISAFRQLMFHPFVEEYDIRLEYYKFRGFITKVKWCPLFNPSLRNDFDEILHTVYPDFRPYFYTTLEAMLGDSALYDLVSIADSHFFNSYLIDVLRFPEYPAEVVNDADYDDFEESLDESDEPREMERPDVSKQIYRCHLELIKQACINPNAMQILPVLVKRIQTIRPPYNVWDPLDNLIGDPIYCFSDATHFSQNFELMNYITQHLDKSFDNLIKLLKAGMQGQIGCEIALFSRFFKLFISHLDMNNRNGFLRQLLLTENDEFFEDVVVFMLSLKSFNDLDTLLQTDELNLAQILDITKQALKIQSWQYILDTLLDYAAKQHLAFGMNDIVQLILAEKLAYGLSATKLAWLHKHGVDFSKPILTDGGATHYWLFEVINLSTEYPQILNMLANDYNVQLDTCDDDGKSILHIILQNEEFREKVIEVISLIKHFNLSEMFTKSDNAGNTLLHCLFSNTSIYISSHIVEIVTILLENSVNATVKNHAGQAPIDLIGIPCEGVDGIDYRFGELVKRNISILTTLKIAIFDKKYGCRQHFKSMMTSCLDFKDMIDKFNIGYLLENPIEFAALRDYIQEELIAIYKSNSITDKQRDLVANIFTDRDLLFTRLLETFRTEKQQSGLFFKPHRNLAVDQCILLNILAKCPIFIYIHACFNKTDNYTSCNRLCEIAQDAVSRDDTYSMTGYCKFAEDLFLKLSSAEKKLIPSLN